MILSSSLPNLPVHRGAPEIREKLLGKLGFFQHGQTSSCPKSKAELASSESKLTKNYIPTPPPPKVARKSAMRTNSQQSNTHVLHFLDYATQCKEPLLIEPGLLFQQGKKIQFFPQVTIVSIPSHRDYPEPIRQAIWSGTRDIHMNGQRNTLEFAADNYDWRKATEEGSFIAADGELYHPTTYTLFIAERKLKTPPPPPPPPSATPATTTTKTSKTKKQPRGTIPTSPATANTSRRKGVRGNRARRPRSRVCLLATAPSLTRFADT
jgi:hypothetical protein